jgi:hypothetical protein
VQPLDDRQNTIEPKTGDHRLLGRRITVIPDLQVIDIDRDPTRERRNIAALNDKFRKRLLAGGRVYLTRGVNEKGPEFVSKALAKVIAFDDFNAGNDPHKEHDLGSFELEGEKPFWRSTTTISRPSSARKIRPTQRRRCAS